MTHPIPRPLSFGEILDGTFTLYRRNFLRFAGTSLLVMAGIFLVAGIVGFTGLSAASVMPGFMQVGVLVIICIAFMAVSTVLWSSVTWQAARAYEGKPAPLGASLEAAGGAAMTLLGCAVLAFAAIGGAAVAVALPGQYIARAVEASGGSTAGAIVELAVIAAAAVAALLASAYFTAVLPVVLLEEKGPWDAVVRSGRLVRGAEARTALLFLVAQIITLLPSLALAMFSGGLSVLAGGAPELTGAAVIAVILQYLLSLVINILTMPFLAALMVVMYYDRRVRTEALDVEISTARLGLAAA
jgi:hypothetical protein